MKPMPVIMPPTAAVLKVCDALDHAIETFLKMRNSLSVGTYEADVEALLIFNLSLRHVEALTALARQDLVLLPAAYSLARAAFECGVRAAWLVDEAEPLYREARWLAHLDGEVSALKRSAKLLQSAGLDSAVKLERARGLQEFRDTLAGALRERGVPLLKKIPKFVEIVSSLGADHLYATYIESSQYTHGGHQATSIYRGNGMGTAKNPGESILPQQWFLPLRMCWLALGYPGDIIISRISGNFVAQWSSECATAVDAAFLDLSAGRSGVLH